MNHRLVCGSNIELIKIDGPEVMPYDSEDTKLRRHCLNRVFAASLSPFNHTLQLDCDTVVEAPIDRAFEPDLMFAKIWSNGEHPRLSSNCLFSQRTRASIRQISLIDPMMSTIAYSGMKHNPFMVNAGVFAFKRQHPFIREWLYLYRICIEEYISDEATAIMLLGYFPDLRLFSDRWNRIKRIGRNWTQRAVIRHLAGSTYKQSGRWRRLRDKVMSL